MLTLKRSPTSSSQCVCNYLYDGTNATVALSGSSCASMSYPYTQAVHFADVNGDGLADYLYVNADGSVTVFVRVSFGWLGKGTFSPGVPVRREEVRFADIDGDGKVDYLVVHANSSVEVWHNLGISGAGVRWTYAGVLASGVGAAGAGVRFADMSGDGLADYVWVADDGSLFLFINNNALTNPWSPWGYVGQIAIGVAGQRSKVQLVDLNGDGAADYVSVDPTNGAATAWINYNQGRGWWNPVGQVCGGFWSEGTGILYADLFGDGRSGLLYVHPDTGAVDAWHNFCPLS